MAFDTYGKLSLSRSLYLIISFFVSYSSFPYA